MDSSGPRDLTLSSNVTIVFAEPQSRTPLMGRGVARFEALLRRQAVSSGGPGGYGGRGFRLPSSGGGGGIQTVTIHLPLPALNTEHLGLRTDYSYALDVAAGTQTTVTITATSSFGALCGLETLAQLAHDGKLGGVHITDAPQYPHRGLMLDTGRRFHPVALVENFLDGMAAVKLNVLHFHLSDQCRFAVESHLFPQLTANLTGIQAGHYTQDEVKGLVQYAKDRGIRVIPEFDMPGHTGGWLPLVGSTAVQFCGSFPAHEERPQLYNDPANATLKVVVSLLDEMSTLFIDEYFNIGSDETFSFANSVGPNCSGSNAAGLEQAVADHVRSVWGRRVMGWDALKTTGNQTGQGLGRKGGSSDTAKVYWHGAPSSETIVSGGIDWVAASKGHSYLDHGTPPSGFWWDIREGSQKDSNGTETTSLLSTGLLGGEACHWTDRYCYIFECLPTWHDKFTNAYNVSSYMYPPEMDAVFAASVSGKIWPRAAVAAGSYWHFTNASWASVTPQYQFITDVLVSRGVEACPTNCTCTELARCGVPYPGAPAPAPRPTPPPGPPAPPAPPAPPHPPTPTTATYSRPCDDTDEHQRIAFVPVAGGTATPVTGRLRNSHGMCIDSQGWTKHSPLGFLPCSAGSDGGGGQLWLHGADGTLSQPPTQDNNAGERRYCLDSFGKRGGKWEVGIFPCSHDTKETWVVGNHSLKDGYDGRCLSDAGGVTVAATAAAATDVPVLFPAATTPQIKVIGRTARACADAKNASCSTLWFDWSSVYIEIEAVGPLSILLHEIWPHGQEYSITLNGTVPHPQLNTTGNGTQPREYAILAAGQQASVRIEKVTESREDVGGLVGFVGLRAAALHDPPPSRKRRIECIGCDPSTPGPRAEPPAPFARCPGFC